MENNTRRNNQWRKLNTDFNRARKRWWSKSKGKQRERVHTTNKSNDSFRHTHTKAAKAEENIKSRIFNLQFI